MTGQGQASTVPVNDRSTTHESPAAHLSHVTCPMAPASGPLGPQNHSLEDAVQRDVALAPTQQNPASFASCAASATEPSTSGFGGSVGPHAQSKSANRIGLILGDRSSKAPARRGGACHAS